MQSFSKRLEQIIKKAGGVVKFAEKAGISRRSLSKYLKGDAEPGKTNILKIAKAANVCSSWFLSGPSDMVCWKDPTWIETIKGNQADSNSQQSPADNLLSPAHKLSVWLSKNLAENNDLQIIDVNCEAMKPTLQPGDLMLVTPQKKEIDDDSIYLIHLNDRKHARRMQRLADGKLKIICDNSAFEDEIAKEKDLNLTVEGKVLGVIRPFLSAS